MVLLGMVLLAGCSDSHLLTGRFRSTTPVVVEGVPGLEGGAWVDLVLGHYGPDVAGIVLFSSEEGVPTPPDGVCRCRFLIDGRFDDGEVIFAFENPSPCTQATTDLLAARLTVTKDGDTLEGPVGRALEGGTRWTFTRILKAADLGTQDKTCDETGAETLPDNGPGDAGPDTVGGGG